MITHEMFEPLEVHLSIPALEMLATALESGKYTKIEGVLSRSVNGRVCHCVLGVLCDISGEGEWVDLDADFRPEASVYRRGFYLKSGSPSTAVTTHVPGALVTKYRGQTDTLSFGDLMSLNDETSMDFKDIAAKIRERIKTLSNEHVST